MKFHLAAFFFTVLLVIGVNTLLYKWWRSENILRNFRGEIVGLFLFVVLPVIYISCFFLFWLLLPVTSSPDIYRYFNSYILVFLVLFIPKFVLSLVLIGDKIVRVFKRRDTGDNIRLVHGVSRRKFLGQAGILLATAPLVTLLCGAFKGRYDFYTRHVRLSFPNLPVGFDGVRVVQISDLHLGSFGTNKEPLAEAVELINAEQPDIILFTGDIVNNFASEMKGWETIFARLEAPLGKFSILGNHDYGNYSRWNSVKDKEENFRGIIEGTYKLGFRLLRNESVKLERGGDVIGLGGVENWGRASYPRYGDLAKTSAGIQDVPFRLLMSHDPDHWDGKILAHDFFDLTLSGHTHGMQFGIETGDFRWSPAQYIHNRWAGLYREGDKFLYVNRGLGYLGLPARVGMPPEITVIELSRGPVGDDPM